MDSFYSLYRTAAMLITSSALGKAINGKQLLTPLGYFECQVKPFGPTNAPAVFQSLLQNMINKFVLVCFDNSLIFSKNLLEHLQPFLTSSPLFHWKQALHEGLAQKINPYRLNPGGWHQNSLDHKSLRGWLILLWWNWNCLSLFPVLNPYCSSKLLPHRCMKVCERSMLLRCWRHPVG